MTRGSTLYALLYASLRAPLSVKASEHIDSSDSSILKSQPAFILATQVLLKSSNSCYIIEVEVVDNNNKR